MTSSIKLRVVIDTNVFVSAVLFDGIPLHVLDVAKVPTVELLMSRIVAEEILTLMRRFNVPDTTHDVVRYMVYTKAHMVAPRFISGVSRDPKDDMLLALSFAGHADYLVTGDKDLLVLRTFGDTKIVTPKQFISTVSAVREK